MSAERIRRGAEVRLSRLPTATGCYCPHCVNGSGREDALAFVRRGLLWMALLVLGGWGISLWFWS